MHVTPSHLISYLYCPRFIYFEHVMRIPQHSEKYIKVLKGREVHAAKARQHTEYLRKRLGVVKKELNVYLRHDPLRGEVDEVLWLNNGEIAPLDYKFARYQDRVYNTYRTQLISYAFLIQHTFGLPVKKGFLIYTRSKNKVVEVPIESGDILAVEKVIGEIERIVQQNYFPRATKRKKRCVDCTYRNLCVR
ncbi:MAG: CRISPR-associated protein Cas4 [Bacteroidota bacterium]